MTASVHAIILAAGASERLGFPKALARFGRRTALQIAVRNVRAAGLQAPIVVLGHAAEFLTRYVSDLRASVVVNQAWKKGQASSFLTGLGKVPRSAAGFILYPVDYPLLRPAHLRRLLATFCTRPDSQIFVPSHARHGGHPVLFRMAIRPEIERLGPGRTLRDIVYQNPGRICFVPINSSAHRADFDTPDQYRRLARRFIARGG